MQQIVNLPIAQILPGNNDRTQFPTGHIESLAASIAAEGLHQPILVRPLAEGRYQIVAGECRYRACCFLQLATVPAIVRPMGDEAASLAMLSENLKRRNLDAIDEANAYQKRAAEFGWSAEQIAAHCTVSADLVRRRLALLELLPDVQQQIRGGALPLGLAECLAGLDRTNQIAAVAALRERETLPTVASFRRTCGALLERQQQCGMFDLESLWAEKLAEADAEKPTKRSSRAEAERLAAELAAERERADRLAAELAAERERIAERERQRAERAAARYRRQLTERAQLLNEINALRAQLRAA